MSRVLLRILLAFGVAAAIATFAIPAGVAIFETMAAGDWGQAALGPRRLELLGNGLRLAALSTVFGFLIAACFVPALARAGSGWRAVAIWLGGCTLLIPPYIFVYAYSLPVLPAGIQVGAPGAVWWPQWVVRDARAVLCLATWSAPLMAVPLMASWVSRGKPAYRLALLDGTPRRMLWLAALPAMRAAILATLLLGLLIGLTEFSVPHLCQVQTWNTEVLAQVQLLARPGSALQLGWPLAVLAVLVCAPLGLLMRRREDEAAGEVAGTTQSAKSRYFLLFPLALLAAPATLLIANLHRAAAFAEFPETYRHEWLGTLLVCLWSAVLSAAISVTYDFARIAAVLSARAWLRRLSRCTAAMTFALAVLGAIVPPVLVGDAVAAAYSRFDWIADHSLIVGLATAGRYAVVPIIAAAATRPDWEALRDALADGARVGSAFATIRLAEIARGVCAAGGVVALLSITEIGATVLVRPPGVGSLSITFLNAIHFGRDDHVIAMSLSLMVVCGVLAVVVRGLALPTHRTGNAGSERAG